MDTILEMRNISKTFPGVKALDNVSFSLERGTTHVLCGENGAGKSTLMKILNGIYQPDAGEVLINGKAERIQSPVNARDLGISMIFQELSYVPYLTVAENIFLGHWPIKGRTGRIDWKTMRAKAQELLDANDLPYSPDTELHELSISDIQMIEILKAVSHGANIIIMDEPTSAITENEIDRLHNKIKELNAAGKSIIYISHKLDEVFKIGHDITIIRDGCVVGTHKVKDISKDRIIELMVGRKISAQYPKTEVPPGETVLDVESLTQANGAFQDISFHVRAGEIVGFAGLMGAGRTEVMRSLVGLDPYTSGTVKIKGRAIQVKDVKSAAALGLVMLSEDRRRYGIIPVRSVKENVSLASLERFFHHGRHDSRKETDVVTDICTKLQVKVPSLDTAVANLSGGNQQKVVFAKWMITEPDIFVADEPTRGIDVNAKREIYVLLNALAAEGKAIVMVSSELPEIIGMCDRVYVMHEGRITGMLHRQECSQEAIMRYAVGQV